MSSVGEIRASRQAQALAVVSALRPHQWTKNLLVFAGLLFSGSLQDGRRWLEALVAFTAFCLVSSAGYLVNDVRDAESDRRHPTKRLRAVASGLLSPRAALSLSVVLAALGLASAAAIGPGTLAFAGAYVGGQLAYTLWLKRVVFVDAAAIAGLFVIRAAAGADAIGVRISSWLLLCTAMLALFLAFAKRRGELLAVADEPSAGRAVLRHYTFAGLGPLVTASAFASCVAYAAYALTGPDGGAMLVTVPFVVFGLVRYLWLMLRHDLGEEPDRVLLTDVPILVAVVLWGLTAAAVLNSM